MNSIEYRKKSHSISTQNLKNTQKTISRKNKNISGTRSVAAFVQNGQMTVKNQQSNIHNNCKINKNNYNTNRTTDNLQNIHGNNKANLSEFNSKRQKNHMLMLNTIENFNQVNSHSFSSYKQAIQKRKKKFNSLNVKNTPDQLLNTLDIFQQTLCSLPLDKLILTQNPFRWVEEQILTLAKLKQKFYKIQNLLKIETKQYYISKIQSIASLIKNIHQNLEMLIKMKDLKDYTSGQTSHQSRNSNSSSNTINLISNQEKNNQISQKQNCLNKISNNKVNKIRNFATDSSDGQKQQIFNKYKYLLHENKQNNMQLSNLPNKGLISVSTYLNDKKQKQIDEKENFVLMQASSTSNNQYKNHQIINLDTLRSSQFNQTNQRDQYEQNYRQQNLFRKNKSSQIYVNQVQKQSNPFLRIDSHIDCKKTLRRNSIEYAKKQVIIDNQNQSLNNQFLQFQQSKQTINTATNCHFLSHSSVFGDETKRNQIRNQKFSSLIKQIEQLKKQLKLKNDIILQIQQKHKKLYHCLKQDYNRKQKQYLQTIYQLKNENKQQKQALRKILQDCEEKYNQITKTQQELSIKNKQLNQYTLNKQLLQKSLSNITQQIKQFKIREQELRQTVKLQRQRTKKQQNKSQQLQNQIHNKCHKIQELQQKNRLNYQKIQNLQVEIQKFTKHQQKYKQKQQIYKQKYFKLSAQFQKFKQKVTDDNQFYKKICLNCKKQVKHQSQNNINDKVIEIRELINFHKKKLLC